MINFMKVGQIDTLQLMLEIQRQPELWNQNRLRKDREDSPHADMDDIWLRYNDMKNFDEENPQHFNDEHDSVWYPAAYCLPSARKIIFDLMAAVNGERLGGILITRIPPGGQIKPHADDSWHVHYYDKFYVSLESGPGRDFYCEEESICPNVGDVYWFDNTKTHWMKNESDGYRTTMIVCMKTHKFGERANV